MKIDIINEKKKLREIADLCLDYVENNGDIKVHVEGNVLYNMSFETSHLMRDLVRLLGTLSRMEKLEEMDSTWKVVINKKFENYKCEFRINEFNGRYSNFIKVLRNNSVISIENLENIDTLELFDDNENDETLELLAEIKEMERKIQQFKSNNESNIDGILNKEDNNSINTEDGILLKKDEDEDKKGWVQL